VVVALISAGGSVALSTTALFLMLNTNLNKLTSRLLLVGLFQQTTSSSVGECLGCRFLRL
jgi:hypothetical protein